MKKAVQKSRSRKSPVRRKRPGKKPHVVKLNWWSISAIIALLIALIIIPISKKDNYEYGDNVPDVHGEYGIDISHNNAGTIIWDSLMVMTDKAGRTVMDKSVAKEIKPVSFVFIKATEGVQMTDSKFRKYWKEAKDHGISRGAYHYFTSSRDGKRQADNFIRTVGPLRHSDLPPVLDIESIHKSVSPKQLNEKALIWLQTVEKHYGRKPIVYTYDYFARDYLSREILDNYPIWIAHYKTDKPVLENWAYWQFSEKALVYGVSHPVDLSIRK